MNRKFPNVNRTFVFPIHFWILTLLSTLPKGVESKKDIGARNNELSNWENKDLDVRTPRKTIAIDLDSKKNIVQIPIVM